MFNVFIKDALDLKGKVKSELYGISYEVGEDLETTQNSNIKVSEITDNISEGDYAFVVDNFGLVIYVGKIKSIKDTTINTVQLTEMFNDEWLYDIVNGTYLEDAFEISLQRFCDGKILGSNYVDNLRKKQFKDLKIKVKTHTEGQFLEQKEQYTTSLTDFIYSLYENYNIIVRPRIPLKNWEIGDVDEGSIDIFKADYDEILISDNVSAIQNLSITTSIEQTNKLVIFSKGSEEEPSHYRTTYIYTEGGIVEEPQLDAGRIKDINTKIVFSDDPDEALIQANIPDEMFNHKITFSLLIDNKIYKFSDFKLGMPIKLFKNGHNYNSVLTAYKIKQNVNEDLIYADFTLGKVRTSLTKKLKQYYGLIRR